MPTPDLPHFALPGQFPVHSSDLNTKTVSVEKLLLDIWSYSSLFFSSIYCNLSLCISVMRQKNPKRDETWSVSLTAERLESPAPGG